MNGEGFRLVQANGRAARSAPYAGIGRRGPAFEPVGQWAGEGSDHRWTRLVPSCAEATFIAGRDAVRATINRRQANGMLVSIDQYGTQGRPSAGRWAENAQKWIRKDEPRSDVKVVTAMVGGALVAVAAGDSDWTGACCTSKAPIRPDDESARWDDMIYGRSGGGRLELEAEPAPGGNCDHFEKQHVYAIAVSFVAGDDYVGVGADASERVSEGQVLGLDAPVALLPDGAVFVGEAVTAIRAQRRADARRVLDTMAAVGSGDINLGAAYEPATGAAFDEAEFFDAVAAMCTHHGITCTDATEAELLEAAKAGRVGYRNEMVCQLSNVSSGIDGPGTAVADVVLGFFASDIKGCHWAATHGGRLRFDAERGSEWTLQMVELDSADWLYEKACARLDDKCRRVLEGDAATESILAAGTAVEVLGEAAAVVRVENGAALLRFESGVHEWHAEKSLQPLEPEMEGLEL